MTLLRRLTYLSLLLSAACGGKVIVDDADGGGVVVVDADAGSDGDASEGSSTTCDTPWTCHGACVDLRTDQANCGACDMWCPGNSMCVSGECH